MEYKGIVSKKVYIQAGHYVHGQEVTVTVSYNTIVHPCICAVVKPE